MVNIEKKVNRIGEINHNKLGEKIEIVEYNKAKDIIVQFENGCKIKTTYQHFKEGVAENPYNKTIYGKGYIGQGKYKAKKNNKHTIQYKFWYGMFLRCYNENQRYKYPTYKNCTVCEEWYDFQVFAEWFDKNYYEIEGQKMHIDKDILVKGNKVYSPQNCIFVPQRINELFTKNDINRGEYPIGVYFHKIKQMFRSQCSILKNDKKHQKILGEYNSPTEAFNVYKTFKESYIKEVADEYKNLIPKELYNALYNYQVQITD